jgi:regulator of sigma E protease
MTVLIFLAVLFVLVLVHEFGHFITAKWSGMRVDEFAIGFPPRLLSWKKGETTYTLNIIPIGGFVRIYGENGAEETSELDTTRAFAYRPRILQAVVLVAGVTMNILFAWALYTTSYTVGVPTIVDDAQPGNTAPLVITSLLDTGVAKKAGLFPGDHIVSLTAADGATAILSPRDISIFIGAHGGTPLSLAYTRGGTPHTVTLTPENIAVPGEKSRPRVGFTTGFVTSLSYPFPKAVVEGGKETVYNAVGIATGLVAFFKQTVHGTAGLGDLTGPIGIAGMVGDASHFGLTAILSFTAFISLNLAVVNMLPLPALDGGRLLIVGIEAIIRRPLNPKFIGNIYFGSFVFLILLMILITGHDIFKLIK